MLELSQEAKMIIASNLTVAAFIRDAAMTIKMVHNHLILKIWSIRRLQRL